MKKTSIPFYDIPTLEKIAVAFLNAYFDRENLEVDIELIVEGKLKWSIVSIPLIENYGAEAFVTRNKIIYIDPYLLDMRERKYRFTLAEEVAHYLLHKDVYGKCDTLEDHLDIYEQITGREYWRMDRNAKYLAAAILMPATSFEEQAFAIYDKIDKKRYSTNEAVLHKIAHDLSNDFNVNEISSQIRFKNLGLHKKLITL